MQATKMFSEKIEVHYGKKVTVWLKISSFKTDFFNRVFKNLLLFHEASKRLKKNAKLKRPWTTLVKISNVDIADFYSEIC